MIRLLTAGTLIAIASVASAFRATLPLSSTAFAPSARGPLHMTTSSFDEWEHEDQSSSHHFHHETEGILDAPPSVDFAKGDELHMLRQSVLDLRAQLHDARSVDDSRKILELQRAILQAQQRDAEFVYSVSLERMEAAEARGRWLEAEKFRQDAAQSREALPQFNLEGLWIGKYGDQGYEMINVTYVGDRLLAHKITGDKNVPKGELTFSVDLSPDQKSKELLEPIVLGEAAAKQWGTRFLTRFSGKGQVAAEGHQNAQFIEGQLILVGEFFSFAWVPLGHQVFFGRPSPELVLKMLRESETSNSVERARAHIQRCMEETEHLVEEHAADEHNCETLVQQDYYDIDGYFE